MRCYKRSRHAICERSVAYRRWLSGGKRVRKVTHLRASSCETDCLMASFFSAALPPLMLEASDEKSIIVLSVLCEGEVKS